MFFDSSIDGISVSERLDQEAVPAKDGLEVSTSKQAAVMRDEMAQYEAIQIDRSIPEKSYFKKLALWSNSGMPFGRVVKHSYQPFMIMSSIPAVLFMALLYGFLTACTTVPITTLSSVMTLPPYSFSSAQIGMMGIPPFIGTSLATLICGPLSDYIVLFLAKRNRGIYEPEMRLWLCLAFTPLVPAGLFMFGIGLNNGAHWLVPAFGLGICAFGVTPASSAALTYLTDAYTDVSLLITIICTHLSLTVWNRLLPIRLLV